MFFKCANFGGKLLFQSHKTTVKTVINETIVLIQLYLQLVELLECIIYDKNGFLKTINKQ